jgi:LPXTG-site transpeptidase (sortase) family protein
MALRALLLALVAALLLVGAGSAQAAPALAPKPAPSDPVRIVIPAIDLDRPLLSVGLDKRRVPIVPKHDIGWYNLSATPARGENVVLWGHVLRFKATPKIPAPFARLKELEIGARMTLYTADGKAHRYVVVEKVWAKPDQVEYILPKGRELVTLVSCIGDKVVANGSVEMTHRLITIAAPAK